LPLNGEIVHFASNQSLGESIVKSSSFPVLFLISVIFSSVSVFSNIKVAQACNPFEANCPDLIPDPFSKDKPLGENPKTQAEKDEQELKDAIKNPGGRSEVTDPKETPPQTTKP
jgi:hypothetical protein